MSVLEASRKMTSREQTAYDLGFHEGQNSAIVHRRWEKDIYGYVYCPNCLRYMPVTEDNGDISANNYCPNCGAKMDGDGNG